MKSRPSNGSGFEDEVKRQLQVLVVKEAEVEALRKQVKKYKDQVTELEEQQNVK